jgi:hypothetical protein
VERKKEMKRNKSLEDQVVRLSPHQEQENNVLIRMLKASRNVHPTYTVGRVVRIVEGEKAIYPVGSLGRILARYPME